MTERFWIQTTFAEDADSYLMEIYSRRSPSVNHGATVSGIRQAQSIAPDILDAWLNLDHTIMYRKSGISRTQREMIATLVSSINQCAF
jgi:alkylhydroperoxidase family enzyme